MTADEMSSFYDSLLFDFLHDNTPARSFSIGELRIWIHGLNMNFEDKITQIRADTGDASTPAQSISLHSNALTHDTVQDCSLLWDWDCGANHEVSQQTMWTRSSACMAAEEMLGPTCSVCDFACEQVFVWSVMPSCMKQAIVTPILKKRNADHTDLSNYLPVSNLSFLSKLIEKVVSHQLTEYLECNALLPVPVCQSAYRANHSTETAVLRVYSDLVTESDAGNISILALLDLSA